MFTNLKKGGEKMLANKNSLILSILIFSLIFSFGFSMPANGASITWTLAHDDIVGGAEDLALNKFAEVVEKLTDGEIKGKVLPARQMGDEKEILQGVKMNTIQASDITSGQFSNMVPEMAIVDLPYAFRGEKHAMHCMNGPIGDFIGKKAEKYGFIVVGYYYEGFRNISGKKPITTLEDMKGLKLRTTPSPTHILGYKALGINTTPIPGGDTYMALKTGLIEATEQPFSYWYENKFYELSKHYNYTQVFNCTTALIVNRNFFESLTPKQQLAVRIAGIESADHYIKIRDRDLAKYIKEAKEKRVQFHDVNLEPLAKACAPARRELAEKFAGKEGLDILDLMEKSAKLD